MVVQLIVALLGWAFITGLLTSYGLETEVAAVVSLIILILLGTGTNSVAKRRKFAAVSTKKENINHWLIENNWDTSSMRLCNKYWNVCTNPQKEELAFFKMSTQCREPDKLMGFRSIKRADMYQDGSRGKASVRLVIQFTGPDQRPYVVPVTDGAVSLNDPEFQQALDFAKRLNDLIESIQNGQMQRGARTSSAVVVKCFNCGQLVKGIPGQKGWCPKCDTDMLIPNK